MSKTLPVSVKKQYYPHFPDEGQEKKMLLALWSAATRGLELSIRPDQHIQITNIETT